MLKLAFYLANFFVIIIIGDGKSEKTISIMYFRWLWY